MDCISIDRTHCRNVSAVFWMVVFWPSPATKFARLLLFFLLSGAEFFLGSSCCALTRHFYTSSGNVVSLPDVSVYGLLVGPPLPNHLHASTVHPRTLRSGKGKMRWLLFGGLRRVGCWRRDPRRFEMGKKRFSIRKSLPQDWILFQGGLVGGGTAILLRVLAAAFPTKLRRCRARGHPYRVERGLCLLALWTLELVFVGHLPRQRFRPSTP